MPATQTVPLKAQAPLIDPQAAPFEVLDHAHQEIATALLHLQDLVAHLKDNGVDEHARKQAKHLFQFFMNHARQHHLDEEKHVFPQLLSSGDDTLIQTTLRLQQDHSWIEQDWLELAPQIESISAGYNWYNIDQLEHSVPVFIALYHDHIQLEESLIYPEAKSRISAWDLKGMGREMAARRHPDRRAA